MSRKFITLIVAASIAVTGFSAAPARAAERDLARALATIAGIAIVGVAINEARKDKRRSVQRQYYQPQRQYYQQPRRYYQPKRHVYQQPRHSKFERAHHHGHIQRRTHRHEQWGQQRYSARPYNYGN